MELDRLSLKELGCGLGTSFVLGTIAAGTTYGVMRVAGALFGSQYLAQQAAFAATVTGGLSGLAGLTCLGVYARQAAAQATIPTPENPEPQQSAITGANEASPFAQAIDANNIDAVRGLLREGYDPTTSNVPITVVDTPAIVEAILSHQEFHPDEILCSTDRYCHDGKMLLTYAVFRRQEETIRLLLQRGADPCRVHPARPEWMASPLHLAATDARGADTLRLFLDHIQMSGGNIDLVNDRGHTPLYLALRSNRADNAALLLQRGANPNGGGIDQAFVHTLQPEAQAVITAVRDQAAQ